jgi:hypothetical protein
MTQQLINVVISVLGGAATYALLKWITVRHGAKTRKAQKVTGYTSGIFG